ncbi:MAG: MerR family DNA-binding transcriptional regulator [Clostridiales bacterium]|nr:MerR family DNA-binding transcriptional regulator [Clostridiales bacterium]
MSITEFAKLVGISPSRLRNYDRKGLFSPAARVEGRENRYRWNLPVRRDPRRRPEQCLLQVSASVKATRRSLSPFPRRRLQSSH